MVEGEPRRQVAYELGKALNFILEFGPPFSKSLDSVINTSYSQVSSRQAGPAPVEGQEWRREDKVAE